MEKAVKKQLEKLEKRENKIVNKKVSSGKIADFSNSIEEKIPKKLKSTLQEAFYKAFNHIFENGIGVIEKTISKEKIALEYDVQNYSLECKISKRALKTIDRRSKQSKLINSGITAAEGAVLGVLGVGVPDIPIFIGVMLRGICETALSYGFTYESTGEKAYMLSIISCALSEGDEKKRLNSQSDLLGTALDSKCEININFDEKIREASNALSDAILTSKFIQGFPIVGVVGSVINLVVYRKILSYAEVKYKKRYLGNRFKS